MKICTSCKQELSLDNFGRHKCSRDGLRTRCKPCEVAANTEYRKTASGAARLRAYRSQQHVAEKMREASSKWLNSPHGRKKKREVESRYPERKQARKVVNWAIRSGKMARLPCEVCGESKSEAHHDDYRKPLDVRWLCVKHHSEWHTNNTPTYQNDEQTEKAA